MRLIHWRKLQNTSVGLTSGVAAAHNPEGSEALPFGPKNHSKVGEGTSGGQRNRIKENY